MEEMYQKISNLLDESFKDRWFLDSGSLLGVVRDGKFLSSDQGIDISVLIDSYHDKTLEILASRFCKLGFVASRYQWGNTIYKYCFVPTPQSGFDYAVDLHLFCKFGEEYLCPQVSLKREINNILDKIRISFINLKKGNPMPKARGLAGKFKIWIYKIYRYNFKYFGMPLQMKGYFTSGEGYSYMWFIPEALLKGVNKSNKYGLNQLTDPDDYLTLRYSNWHIPVSDWCTIRDDGGLRKCTAEDYDVLLK